MSKTYLEKAKQWLSSHYDEQTKKQVKHLIINDIETLKDSFYKNLEFGTGGIRGIMGVGTNRINIYTLGIATQGLANYINKQNDDKKSVVIAYDCRNNSQFFAKKVAEILSANDIEVYLFEDLRPTPELSFAIRYLNCKAGIIITASHNPLEYNGYKVYWEDGGQIVPPHDKNIINEVNQLQIEDIKFLSNKNLIKIIGNEIDEAFIKSSLKAVPQTEKTKSDLKIVFTPIHGTSYKLVPQILLQAGFKNVYTVKEQMIPDGNFSTVKSPNPEEKEALAMAVNLAKQKDADILMGTDPDADRIGVAIKNSRGEIEILNGNQTATIMTYYLLNEWQKNDKINGKQFICSTIVTTPLLEKIATNFKVECQTVLTGFKWIGKSIFDLEEKKEFIGGGEESYGYMIGHFVRDKDAVTSALLICEIAQQMKTQNKTLLDYLIDIYAKFGLYKEHLITITKKGISGSEEIKNIMNNFRENHPKTFDNSLVEIVEDYQNSVSKNILNQKEKNINLPKSNVLIFKTKDGSRVAVRPSGTEPKIKFYISVKNDLPNKNDFEKINQQTNDKIERIVENLKF